MSFFGGNLIWNVAKRATSAIINKSQEDLAVVYSIILDENHPLIKSGESSIADVGSIQCRLLNDVTGETLLVAKPLDSTVTILPIRNQTVFIQKLGSGYVYSQISKGLSPNTSDSENLISNLFNEQQSAEGGSKAEGYSNVSATGIARSNTKNVNDFDGFGDYFTAESGIHKLKLYEGDVLFQSRFGQSIRLSGYNNSENKFSPTLTIRSGESPENRKKDDNVLVEENINEDSNIIFLGSGEKLLEWTLPTTNEKESFYNYPSELKGNQILLSSDRIILSSKGNIFNTNAVRKLHALSTKVEGITKTVIIRNIFLGFSVRSKFTTMVLNKICLRPPQVTYCHIMIHSKAVFWTV